jgi:GNAT superfamily N-acetyltransferase
MSRVATSDARVRPATAADIPVLRRLYDEFHAFHVRGVPERLLLPVEPQDDAKFVELIVEVLADERAMLLVAESDGQIVGLAEMYVRDDEASPYKPGQRYGHVQSLAVTEASRRHGIGVLLLREAETWASGQGASEIRTDVWEFAESPLPFYEQAGYQTLRRTLIKRSSD